MPKKAAVEGAVLGTKPLMRPMGVVIVTLRLAGPGLLSEAGLVGGAICGGYMGWGDYSRAFSFFENLVGGGVGAVGPLR